MKTAFSQPLFLSLGSNYIPRFTALTLWSRFLSQSHRLSALENIQKIFAEQFQGQAFLFYKGRDAIEFVLRAHGLTQASDVVLTQAFTCFAIEEAIQRAGASAGYVDIESGKLNLSVRTLQDALKKYPSAKAVIVQHSLGHPAEIQKISEWCQKNRLLLIEDLAQSYGGKTKERKLLGQYADAVISSFGRDKIVDTVTGGVAILKATQPTQKTAKKVLEHAQKVYKKIEDGPTTIGEAFYPFFTFLIRKTYSFGLGKILHRLLTKTGIMTNPIQANTNKMSRLPLLYAPWIEYQLNQLDKQLAHRREMAKNWLKIAKNIPDLKKITTQDDIEQGTVLRVALWTKDPEKIVQKFSKNSGHFSDRWYRSPVDCGRTHCQTAYENRALPNAEKMSAGIVNLPTHFLTTKKIIEKFENM